MMLTWKASVDDYICLIPVRIIFCAMDIRGISLIHDFIAFHASTDEFDQAAYFLFANGCVDGNPI
jgi:hypothetical protein